jgi:hypothetical protein
MSKVLEKGIAFMEIMAKLMTKDSKSPSSIAKTSGHNLGRRSFQEEGSQGFILPMKGFFGA